MAEYIKNSCHCGEGMPQMEGWVVKLKSGVYDSPILNRGTAEQRNSGTADQRNSGTAEQQISRAAEQQNCRR